MDQSTERIPGQPPALSTGSLDRDNQVWVSWESLSTAPSQPGIYAIRNGKTGRIGVGLASRSIKVRLLAHRHAMQSPGSVPSPIVSDARRYGLAAFEFCVLELFPEHPGLNHRRVLRRKEGEWADRLMTWDEATGYNLEAGGKRSPACLFRERERRLLAAVPARYQLLPHVRLEAPICHLLLGIKIHRKCL